MKDHRVLEKSDVVFMYASPEPQVYQDFGATVVAWGGANTREQVKLMDGMGIHATGSMWCLTAGAQELHENADLRDATIKDIQGKPIIVPWLYDRLYEGTPSWWGCGNHPSFKAHMRKKVCECMAGGAYGLHVDDHLSNALPALEFGGCFCDYCMRAFARYLDENASTEVYHAAGVESFKHFDYRDIVRKYATTKEQYIKVQKEIPLYQEYVDFQLHHAAENVRQLGELAAEIVERPVSLSANTGIPYIEHVVVTPLLSYMVGEVVHHAKDGTDNLLETVKAYRMAEAIGKEIATTAKGYDWAYVKEHQCEQLVRTWISLGYACGQRLMAPTRAWCFTPEKGNHWYHGTAEMYADLYQFVRKHRDLFDGFKTVGPLKPPVNVPTSFGKESNRRELQNVLAEGNVHPLTAGDRIWLFPRAHDDGRAVVHVVNMAYQTESRSHLYQHDVVVDIGKNIFGCKFDQAVYIDSQGETVELAVMETLEGFRITVPEIKLWGIIKLEHIG